METKEQIMRNILAKLPHATKEELCMMRGLITGCHICGWFSPKQQRIYEISKMLEKLPTEEVEYIQGFVEGYAEKKGKAVSA